MYAVKAVLLKVINKKVFIRLPINLEHTTRLWSFNVLDKREI
jgi:hypothetical protein